MQTPFPFDAFLAFGTMSIFLLIGVLLRARIRFFQRYLIPSCLIAGVIGLVLLNITPSYNPISELESIAYHFFNISFISVGLMALTSDSGLEGKGSKKSVGAIAHGALWGALIEGVSISTQAIIGCLVVVLLGIVGIKLFPTFGLFAPLGFTEGPGQALSIGKIWEGLGFQDAATIGLTFAAIGFAFAFFVGVPLVNWGIKKTTAGKGITARVKLSEDFKIGIVPKGNARESAGQLPMHSANIDSLAFQAALVGLVYILTYGFTYLLSLPMDPTTAKTLWGFFFFFGMFIAMLIGWILRKMDIAHLVDSGIQKRITGWSIDYLIIATIMAIKPSIVLKFILPIAIISILSGLATFAILVYFGKRTNLYNVERMVVMFGTCTGTVSSGLLLLRISDPNFDSPVALEVGVMTIIAVPAIVISMILVNAYFYWNWGLWTIMSCFLVIALINLLLLKISKHWGSPKF